MAQLGSVVITTADDALGRALAVGFSRDGSQVVGLGDSHTALEETAALCAPGRFSGEVVDRTDADPTRRALEALSARAGRIDVLICNTVLYPRAYFLDQTAQDWAEVIHANVCGPADYCRVVLPDMLRRGYGRIVVLGSLADMSPIPAASAYSVSKAAVHVLVRAIAAEIDRGRFPNVLINEFNPGATRRGLTYEDDDASLAYLRIKRLIELPAGGPTGRIFMRDKEVFLDRTPKAQLHRMLRRWVGRV